MDIAHRSARGARLRLAALFTCMALMAVGSPAWASDGDSSVASAAGEEASDVLDRAAIEKRFRHHQGYWTVQVVLTSSFAAVPLTAR